MKSSTLFLRFAALAAASLAHITAVAATPAPSAGATLIVLDASGSMNERIGGETKMAIARRAVHELVDSLPAGTQLGLVAYSHRRSSCDDIELLIPPGPLDRAAFLAAVDALRPKGRTPLSAALEFAASALDYTKAAANIVLVSDGVETCGRDPCATALQLAQAAHALKIHAVAFDLSAREGKSFECIATATNGRFLQANDAASLRDALVLAVAEATAPPAPTPPAELLTPATLRAPAEAPAGATFPVAWTGPDNPGDYLTIVPQGAADDSYGNTTYTRQGTPLSLTAPIDAGAAEVRYVAARSRTILARAPVLITKVEVTLSAPETTNAGAAVSVAWTGPKNRGDYVTIVPPGAADDAYTQYAEAAKGSPLDVTAPLDAGEAEIRYVSGQGRRVLARRPIKIVAPEIALDAPAEAIAGAEISIAWAGPNNPNDFLVVVPKSTPDGGWNRTAYTRAGSPVKLLAPIEPGDAEIRYLSGFGFRVLARRDIKVVRAEITLDAPAEAIAGAEISVAWTGPNNPNDFLVVVPKSTPDGGWNRTTYTRAGTPAKLFAPIEPGEAEIRYLSGSGNKVLARRAIQVVAPVITLDAPAEAIAGSEVLVAWTGPNNPNDFLAIVPKNAPDGSWSRTAQTRAGTPAKLAAPAAAGEGEIRYLSGYGHKVLARRSITILPKPAPP